MDARRPDRLAALTGLRFAAALGILLYHQGGPVLAGAPAWAERVRAGGHVWVSLFYLLSGYALQEPLWLWARQLAGEPQAPASRAFVVAFSAAAIGIAVAVSRWLERPARRALRAALRGGPHPARAGPLPLARGESEA